MVTQLLSRVDNDWPDITQFLPTLLAIPDSASPSLHDSVNYLISKVVASLR